MKKFVILLCLLCFASLAVSAPVQLDSEAPAGVIDDAFLPPEGKSLAVYGIVYPFRSDSAVCDSADAGHAAALAALAARGITSPFIACVGGLPVSNGATLAGVPMVASAGTFTVTVDTTAATLVGVEMTSAAGELLASVASSNSAALTGVDMAASAGALTADIINFNRSLTGVQLTASAGTLTAEVAGGGALATYAFSVFGPLDATAEWESTDTVNCASNGATALCVSGAFWADATVFSADQYAEIYNATGTVALNSSLSAWVRKNPSTSIETFYSLVAAYVYDEEYNDFEGGNVVYLSLYETTTGTQVPITGIFLGEGAASFPEAIRLEIVGSALTGKYRTAATPAGQWEATTVTTTDASITSGKPGFASSIGRADNFAAGDM